MASRFSGALQITNLDDFITPSQECIKPIDYKKPSIANSTGAKIKIKDDTDYKDIIKQKAPEKLEKVEITLADCLACSGCITSAESVLVTQQNQEELMRIFKEKRAQEVAGEPAKFIVVSLSVQPVLSIAEKYELDSEDTALRLAGYFKELGADMVLDMTVADDFSLLESAKEFVNRFNQSREGNKSQIPMLASSCPGWICYAEKTHGNFILPYISITKSPQQIMGSLVKNYLAKLKNISPENIYHITLMPCYDKKLEAYREDFHDQLLNSKDVDCVITPIELEQIIDQENNFKDMKQSTIDTPFGTLEFNSSRKNVWRHEGSGSGGFADFILNYAARNIFGINDCNFEFKDMRNPDFKEATLERDGQVLLHFAITNGFRNIQNLVQKLKRNKCTYHYVEVMACPAGCLNGGAQIRPQNSVQSRQTALTLESKYQELPVMNPESNRLVQKLYDNWLGGESSEKTSKYLHTQYHEIEKMNVALNIKW